MAFSSQPLTIGQTSTDASLAALLGTITTVDAYLTSGAPSATAIPGQTWFRLVRTSAVIAAVPGSPLIFDTTNAGTVGALAGAAADRAAAAGFAVLPTGTTTVASGTYLWVAFQGPCLALFVGAVTANTRLAVHAGNGLDDLTVTSDTSWAYSRAAVAGAGTSAVIAALGQY
jgi:hypothetical protein